MADIAAVFHWPLAELMALSVEDLFMWRNRAVAVWDRMNNTPKA